MNDRERYLQTLLFGMPDRIPFSPGCPVANRDDWEAMKSRYNPEDPARVPENLPELGRRLAKRDYPIGVSVHGPFWQLREWLGFEGLCLLFHDDPALVREMVRFWTDYISRLLERVLPHVPFDYLHISEDMAYRVKPMIGPEMTRAFLLPCYRQCGEILRAYQVPIYDLDSDGYVGHLIPVCIKGGVNIFDPMEVAAGNDIQQYRREFGRKMAFQGGVDKRALAQGGETMRAELARIEPVVRDGGYIPGCDHAVPPDISLPNFLDYCDLLSRMTGWK